MTSNNEDAIVELNEVDALQAYATMINTCGFDKLTPLLAEDFRYTSQTVLTDIEGRSRYLSYMAQKLAVTRDVEDRAVAEMAYLPSMYNRACLVLVQRLSGREICTVLASVKDGQISQIDLCLVPAPASAIRTGTRPT